jgi:non-specific serine/threonine protein kinase
MAETLVRKIRDMNMLIILDNCEHLAEACAETAGKLIQSVPGLKILATSRAVLNIKGEKAWRVPNLSLIEEDKIKHVEQAEDSEAILLFTDRSRLSDAGFKLVDENIRDVATICKRLDGIPLAIEILACRARYMDPATMLERLSGRFSKLTTPDPGTIDRHKTLNATIDWSFNLLTVEEKTVFRRLSIFSGSFDLKAVEEICLDESLPGEYALDILSSLVDRSMVNTLRNPGFPMRYYLLETLRQYAAALLGEKEENSLRRKQLIYYNALADKGFKKRLDAQARWMNTLHVEHDNIISALNWAKKHNYTRYALLAGSLSWFWARTNNYNLARPILERIISEGYARKDARAKILYGYAWILAADFHQFSKVIELLKKSHLIWRRLNNKKEEAVLLADLAMTTFGSGDDEIGMKYAELAYELAQIVNDPGALLHCMLSLSQGYVNTRQFAKARPIAEKIVMAGEKLNNLHAQFIGTHNQADCAIMEGKFHESERKYSRGLQITREYDDILYTCIELTGLAMSVAGMGRHKKALRLMGAVNEIAGKAGIMSPEEFPLVFWQEQLKIHIKGTREKLGEKLTGKYESEGRAMDLDDTIRYALEFDKD